MQSVVIKITTVGPSQAGKTTLVTRFVDGSFNADLASTIGADFKVIDAAWGPHHLKFQIWDTAGQERFRSLAAMYMRGARGTLLCVDGNESDLATAKLWAASIPDEADSVRLLVVTKADLPQKVNRNDLEEFARTCDLQGPYYCSSKTGVGVTEVFTALAGAILPTLHLPEGQHSLVWHRKPTGGVDSSVSGDAMSNTHKKCEMCTTTGAPLAHVALTSVVVCMEVSDWTVNVVLCQTFVNTSSQPTEAVYYFPIPPATAVTNVEVLVHGERYFGIITEVGHAIEQYDDTVAAGDQGFLVEKAAEGLLRMSIGNLQKGEECTIQLRWVGEVFCLTNPTTRHVEIPNAVLPSGNSCTTRFGLKANITTRPTVQKVESPTHKISCHNKAGCMMEVVCNEMNNNHTTSFKLVIHTAGVGHSGGSSSWLRIPFYGATGYESSPITFPTSVVVTKTQHVPPEYTYALALPLCLNVKDTNTNIGEYLLIVDCSGSMAGGAMEQAKRVAELFLHSLPSGSRFNLIKFGTNFSVWANCSKLLTDDSLRKGKRWVKAMDANMGGTNLLQPLHTALLPPSWVGSHTLPRHVIVITDGQVSNSKDVFQLIKTRRCEGCGDLLRVNAVGVGNSVDSHLVYGIAKEGAGQSAFVEAGKKSLSSKIISFLQTSQVAVLSRYHVKLRILDDTCQPEDKKETPSPGGDSCIMHTTSTQQPKPKYKIRFATKYAPPLVSGLPSHLYAFVSDEWSGPTADSRIEVTLETSDGKGTESKTVCELDIAVYEQDDDHHHDDKGIEGQPPHYGSVHLLAAVRRLQEMEEDREYNHDEDICEWAKAFGLISSQTSFFCARQLSGQSNAATTPLDQSNPGAIRTPSNSSGAPNLLCGGGGTNCSAPSAVTLSHYSQPNQAKASGCCEGGDSSGGGGSYSGSSYSHATAVEPEDPKSLLLQEILLAQGAEGWWPTDPQFFVDTLVPALPIPVTYETLFEACPHVPKKGNNDSSSSHSNSDLQLDESNTCTEQLDISVSTIDQSSSTTFSEPTEEDKERPKLKKQRGPDKLEITKRCWVTALVLRILEVSYWREKHEWCLIGQKAQGYLQQYRRSHYPSLVAKWFKAQSA